MSVATDADIQYNAEHDRLSANMACNGCVKLGQPLPLSYLLALNDSMAQINVLAVFLVSSLLLGSSVIVRITLDKPVKVVRSDVY
jgi:hypothetical protein